MPDRNSVDFRGSVAGGRTGGRRHGPLLIVGGWVMAVAVVAGAAIVGGGSSSRPVADDRAVLSPDASAAPRERSVRIDQPARQDDIVRTREIVVQGEVTARVARVWVSLESGGRPIATRSIDLSRLPGNDLLSFKTRFRLDRPRPTAALFVMVVAIGDGGVPIDAMRRRFTLGESIEPGSPVPNAVSTD